MELAGIIALLQVVITNLPGAIKTAQELYDLGAKFFETIHGKAPTTDELAQLEAMIDADVVEALGDLPEAQPGDPDYVKPTT